MYNFKIKKEFNEEFSPKNKSILGEGRFNIKS